MTVFTILSPTGDNANLAASIETHFTNDFLKIGPGQWLVAARITAVEVSNKLGITTPPDVSGIVFATSSYFGRADNSVWDWIRVKLTTV
jgi:hypothetical protein